MREDFFEKIVIFSLTQKSYYSIILLVFDRYILCDSGVVGNARPCQGRDRGFEPRLSLFLCPESWALRISQARFFFQAK